jgi:hypothetical protein
MTSCEAMTKKNGEKRRRSRTPPVPIPAVLAEAFGPVVLRGICILCQTPLIKHFSAEGRYVGCEGRQRPDSSSVPMYIAPVLIDSHVLNGILAALPPLPKA